MLMDPMGRGPFGAGTPTPTHAHASHLQRVGSHILGGTGGGGGGASGYGSAAGSRPPSSGAASSAGGRQSPGSISQHSMNYAQFEYPPVPPSASRTGRLWHPEDQGLQLTPRGGLAEHVAAMERVRVKRVSSREEAVPKMVWSDSVQHLGEEPWPAHAVPLFVFSGPDRPRPAYREQVKFSIKDEKYVNFGLRLRCGGGDRYMGGSLGLVHSPNRSEALPGQEGQLVTVIDVIVMADTTLIVTAVGDLPFTIQRSWMPRGMRGLQCAIVDVQPAAPRLHSIMDTCVHEPKLARFADVLRVAAPGIAELLATPNAGPFTVFVPTDRALRALLGNMDVQDLAGRADVEALLQCHVVSGKVACEALYSGRTLMALDGTSLMVTFGKWPRADPRVNDVPVEHMDVMCGNGVIHTINGLLKPSPALARRSR